MSKQPLAEVFGFPISNDNPEAKRHRKLRLCPFGNNIPNCTKDKAKNPLGVCSIFNDDNVVITCPIRFRQSWLIAEDAASFFFPDDAKWTTLTEVKLKDKHNKAAGNIDVILVSYDEHGKLADFGALEVQAVYISGNVRNPFEHFMKDPGKNAKMVWQGQPNYPKPDYLSSSRKRLAPQLIFKGGIFNAWNKKMAVALNRSFFDTLPDLVEVNKENADIAWFVYDLKRDSAQDVYKFVRDRQIYTKFHDSLSRITQSEPGNVADFIQHLQEKVDEKLESNPPDTETIHEVF